MGDGPSCAAPHLTPWPSVPRCMSRAATAPTLLPAPDLAPPESEPTEEGPVGPLEPSPGVAQPMRRDLGKVPKWLKLPGTVGAARPGAASEQEPRAPRSSWPVCFAASKR